MSFRFDFKTGRMRILAPQTPTVGEIRPAVKEAPVAVEEAPVAVEEAPVAVEEAPVAVEEVEIDDIEDSPIHEQEYEY